LPASSAGARRTTAGQRLERALPTRSGHVAGKVQGLEASYMRVDKPEDRCGQATHEPQRRHRDELAAVTAGRLQSEHHRPGSVAMHASVGQRWTRDAAAPLLECLAVIGSASHRPVQAQALPVGTKHRRERCTAPCNLRTTCPAPGPTTMRQVQAAACRGLSVRALYGSTPSSGRWLDPASPTHAPRQVSKFLKRPMIEQGMTTHAAARTRRGLRRRPLPPAGP